MNKKGIIVVSVAAVSIIALGWALSSWFSQAPVVNFSLKAAIIDQLGKEFPNPSFVGNATNILEAHGFNVTYHNETLDVDFFRGLAKYNYGIIILRVHSALREGNSTVDLFTSEEFTPTEHQDDLNHERLVPGEYLYEPGKYYFAITSRFVENLEGYFPKSIIIAMGCWSLKPGLEQMADAFIRKGAKAYIGWTDLVLQPDTDSETLKLLRLLLVEDKPLSDAVSATLYHAYGTHLNFYPKEVGSLKVSQLISEVKTSLTLPITADRLPKPEQLRYRRKVLVM